MSGDEGGRREERRFAAASTAAARADYIPRDRDPPPTYDGENPETTFRQFEKQAQLWLFETEVPETKRGVKLLRQLTGVAATAVDDMEVSEIVHEQGVKNIMQKLREYFTPHLEVSLPRAFETAVYGTPKQTKETFAEYAKRMERAFTNLAKEGVDLPADARGYILYRQASLTEAQDQKLLTWTQGKYSRAEVTSALRRLDKVVRDKAKSSFQVEGTYLTEDSMDDNRAFFVRIDEENTAAAESGAHFWFQQETSERQAKDGTGVVFDDAERSDVGAYMERQPGAITFCGISTQPHHGVVDTAAEGGLVGTGPLKNIEVELARHALKVRWIPKKSQAKGVGGAATVEGTVLIPIGIAGVNGILECTVVQGDVPLLLPVRMLRALESLIDLKRGTMTLQSHGRIVDLHQLPSGHVTIDVFQFASGKFVVPDDAGSQEDFETRKPSCFLPMSALLAKAKQLVGVQPTQDAVPMEVHPKVYNSKVPIRNWRVIMDKIAVILILAAMQDATEAWCLELGSQRLGPSSADSLEDYYSEVIRTAKTLAPLKSKEAPRTAISACTHPKNQLRGGGNGSASYIVCRQCHSRWAHNQKAADVRKLLKQGPLSITQGVTIPTTPSAPSTPPRATMTMPTSPPTGTGAMEAHGIYQQLIPYSPGSPSQEQIAQLQESLKSQMEGQAAFLMHQMRNEQAASVIKMSEMNMTQMHQFSEEMKKAAQASREQELRQEKLLQMLVQMKEEQAKADPAGSLRNDCR
ncbi:unnamed protein product [Durusdinium trenchii]|uniref:Retrotransposon gag domain-containing protein n=1 Tax=Durusdinium trenchii TaxID=1381693 RepID=A0ABP0N0W7_9DINO